MKVSLALALAAATVPALAGAHQTPALDKASFTLALAIPDSNTKISFDSNSTDSPIDFDKDLGLGTSNIVASFGATWRPWKNHQFSFTYYNDSNASTNALDEPFEWEGVLYDGTVKAKSNVTTYDASYIWWGLNRDTWALGPRVGVVYYDLGLQVDLTLDTEGNPVVDGIYERSVNPAIPVPTLGAAWRWTPADNWRIRMDAGYFSAEIGDFDGSFSFIGGGVEWFPREHWGLSLNLVRQNLDVNAAKVDYNGDLDITGSNASLGITYRF